MKSAGAGLVVSQVWSAAAGETWGAR